MGERFLGRISSVAGESKNNLTTTTPFSILPGEKLTLYASAAGRVAVDYEICTNTVGPPSGVTAFGVPISAQSLFPTSVGQGRVAQANAPASGPTAVISFIPTVAAATDLDVWVRGGQE